MQGYELVAESNHVPSALAAAWAACSAKHRHLNLQPRENKGPPQHDLPPHETYNSTILHGYSARHHESTLHISARSKMAARGQAGTRGSTRFAQFKLVLLGM